MGADRFKTLHRATLLFAFAALCVASVAAASNRIAVPADGIGTSGDWMGAAVALSGDTAAVGIPHGVITPFAAPGAIAIFRNVAGAWQRETFLGPGLASTFALQQDTLVVGGTQQVVTFVRNGTTWSQHDVLATPAYSVALSGDTLLVAGSAANAYLRSNGTWSLQATLAGDQPNETISSVALDGDVAAILGFTPTERSFLQAYVHFYHRSGASWTLESTIPEGLFWPGGSTSVELAVSGETVLVGYGSVTAYVRDQGNWSTQGVLDPLVPTTVMSIAIDGDRAILGSPPDDIPGVPAAGSAYVFERSNGAWSRTDHVADADASAGAAFGSSLALEGDKAIVGSLNAITAAGDAGHASVFDLGTQPATDIATLDAGNAHAHENFGARFGASGSTLVVGALNADTVQYVPYGAAYVFGLDADTWTLEAELHGPAGTRWGFGTSAAASADTVVVGSPHDNQTGAAYVYTRADGTWPKAAQLAPDDGSVQTFGEEVAFDGDRIAVAAPFANTVYLYTGSGSSWLEEASLVPSTGSAADEFGTSLSLAGDTLIVGAPGASVGIETGAGLAFVFVDTGSGWAEQAVLQSPAPLAYTHFGSAVSIRGDLALVGANYSAEGAQRVYVFRRGGTAWTLETTLDVQSSTAQNVLTSLAISPDESMIAVGLPPTFPGGGLVSTFVRANGNWAPARTFVDDGPGNPGGMDGFGAAVAFLDKNLLVGAPQDGAGGAVYEYGVGDQIFASGFDPIP